MEVLIILIIITSGVILLSSFVICIIKFVEGDYTYKKDFLKDLLIPFYMAYKIFKGKYKRLI